MHDTVIRFLAPCECVRHKTEEGCKFGEKVCVWKRTRSLRNAIIAIGRSDQKLRCVSQDVELPEQTVGLTTESRSIPKRNGKRSPRAHLELEYTKTAESHKSTFGNNCTISASYPGWLKNHRNPNARTFEAEIQTTRFGSRIWCKKSRLELGQACVQTSRTLFGERSCILQTKVGMGNIIHLNRQSRRKVLYCSFWSVSANDEQDGLVSRRIGNCQSLTTSHNSDHSEWVSLQSRNVQDLDMFVRVQPASRTHQRCYLWENTAKNKGALTSGKKFRHRIFLEWLFCTVISCPSSFLADQVKKTQVQASKELVLDEQETTLAGTNWWNQNLHLQAATAEIHQNHLVHILYQPKHCREAQFVYACSQRSKLWNMQAYESYKSSLQRWLQPITKSSMKMENRGTIKGVRLLFKRWPMDSKLPIQKNTSQEESGNLRAFLDPEENPKVIHTDNS